MQHLHMSISTLVEFNSFRISFPIKPPTMMNDEEKTSNFTCKTQKKSFGDFVIKIRVFICTSTARISSSCKESLLTFYISKSLIYKLLLFLINVFSFHLFIIYLFIYKINNKQNNTCLKCRRLTVFFEVQVWKILVELEYQHFLILNLKF